MFRKCAGNLGNIKQPVVDRAIRSKFGLSCSRLAWRWAHCKSKKMDSEVLQQIQRYTEPETYATTPDHIALKYITVVGSDGHFIGIQHT